MAERNKGRVASARSLVWHSSESVRDVNRRKIIRAVMAAPASQVILAERTWLSQATVSTVVGELEREGLFVVESTGRGRRVRLGSVRGVAVGVEVDHDRVVAIARRVDATTSDEVRIDAGVGQDGDQWVRHAVQAVGEAVERTGLAPEHIVSIGMGVPTAVDPRTSRGVNVCSFWDLSGDPGGRIREHFPDVPVTVDNNVNYAAYGEYVHGVAAGRGIMLFLKSSRGVGAGLIIDRIIYRGRRGLAGEIGHLTIDPIGPVCRCGNRGCLETFVSGARLLEQVKQACSGYSVDLPTSLESMVERAKRGDLVCRRVLQDAARVIGLALAKSCTLMDPEFIVVGGELGRAADLLLEVVGESLRHNALSGFFDPAVAPTKVVASELGTSAGACGALTFALERDVTVPGFGEN